MVTETQYLAKTKKCTQRIVKLRDQIHELQWKVTVTESKISKLKRELQKAETAYTEAASAKIIRKGQ